jgi:hypothetical protein
VTTQNSSHMSILDAAKAMGADGLILNCAELLDKKKGMLQDIPWEQTDTPEGHVSAQTTSLPTVSDVVYNQEGTASKSTVANIMESCQGLEVWLTPDDRVLSYGGNPAAKMSKEVMRASEAMKQGVQTRYITGNGDTTPGQLYGFYSRLGSLSSNAARNIIDCDGTGSDNASILYVRWSPDAIYGLYPKGSKAGLNIEDFGRVPVTTSSGEIVRRKVRLDWFFGLAIDDWRQAARACNIDVPALLAGTGADLPRRMRDLQTVVEDNEHGVGAYYMNRTLAGRLREQTISAVGAGGGLTFRNFNGDRVMEFDGIPVRIIDDMPITESRVT